MDYVQAVAYMLIAACVVRLLFWAYKPEESLDDRDLTKRTDWISTSESLMVTHRKLLVMIAQHEARPHCAQNPNFLEVAYRKLREVEKRLEDDMERLKEMQ